MRVFLFGALTACAALPVRPPHVEVYRGAGQIECGARVKDGVQSNWCEISTDEAGRRAGQVRLAIQALHDCIGPKLDGDLIRRAECCRRFPEGIDNFEDDKACGGLVP